MMPQEIDVSALAYSTIRFMDWNKDIQYLPFSWCSIVILSTKIYTHQGINIYNGGNGGRSLPCNRQVASSIPALPSFVVVSVLGRDTSRNLPAGDGQRAGAWQPLFCQTTLG